MTPAPVLSPTVRWWLRRAWDVALFILGFFVTVMATGNVPGTQVEDSLTDLGAAVWLLTLLAWVTVFFRRRAPWLTLLAGLALAALGTEYLLFLLGAFHVLIRTEGRRRLAVAAGTVTVVTLYVVRATTTSWGYDVFGLDDGSGVSPWVATIAVAAMSLVVTAGSVALSLSRRATSAQRQRADAEQRRASTLGDELARQAERQDLAREIHDGLTNRLALLSMMGGNVARAVERGDPASAELARTLQAQSREALGDLRGLVHDLRQAPSDPTVPRGSMRAVPSLIADARAARTNVSAVVILDSIDTATASLDAGVHRMAQESLTNAVKHAPDMPVSFYLEASPATGVRLRVTNPLATHGGGELGGSGMGLIGIGERAAALGGTAWTGAHEGEFIVDVTLPWTVEADDAGAGRASTVTP